MSSSISRLASQTRALRNPVVDSWGRTMLFGLVKKTPVDRAEEKAHRFLLESGPRRSATNTNTDSGLLPVLRVTEKFLRSTDLIRYCTSVSHSEKWSLVRFYWRREPRETRLRELRCHQSSRLATTRFPVLLDYQKMKDSEKMSLL